jgi:hypothetical protein
MGQNMRALKGATLGHYAELIGVWHTPERAKDFLFSGAVLSNPIGFFQPMLQTNKFGTRWHDYVLMPMLKRSSNLLRDHASGSPCD